MAEGHPHFIWKKKHEFLCLYKFARCSKPHWRHLTQREKRSAGDFQAANNKQAVFLADIHYVHTQTDMIKRIHAQGNKES